MKLYFHIGGPKCASSSIQQWLTANNILLQNDKAKAYYIPVRESGELLLGHEIKNRRQDLSLYLDSSQLLGAKLVGNGVFFEQQVNKLCKRAGKDASLIFSSEGFCYSSPVLINRIIEEFKQYDPELQSYAFFIIRPQVEWLNSGYFQWFAFNDDANLDKILDEVLDPAVGPTWLDFIKSWKENVPLDDFIIRPLSKNIMQEFCQWLDVSLPNQEQDTNNQSLGDNLIRFIIHNQQALDRKIHTPDIDFLFEQLFAHDTKINGKKPFIWNKDEIKKIIEHFRPINAEMLQYLDEHTQQTIVNNPKWWDADAYDHLLNNSYHSHQNLEDVNNLAVALSREVLRLTQKSHHDDYQIASAKEMIAKAKPLSFRRSLTALLSPSYRKKFKRY